jgi:hypothetical protein
MNSSAARTVYKTIAVVEIAGGIYAVVGSILALIATRTLRDDELLTGGVWLMVLGLVAIAAGIGLWRREYRGWRASIVLQLAQIPVVVLPQFHYSAYLLLRIAAGIVNGSLNVTAEAGAECFFRLGVASVVTSSTVASVNVLAMACALLLWGARDQSSTATDRAGHV